MADLIADLDTILDVAHSRNLPVIQEAARALITAVSPDTRPEELLTEIGRVTQAAHDLERAMVRRARMEGLSWDDIGDKLGVSGPGARKRYGSNDLEDLDRLDALHDAELQALRSEIELRKLRDPRLQDPRNTETQAAMSEMFPRMLELVSSYGEQRRELIARLDRRERRRRSR